jgi:hypothetical protein
LIDISAFGAKNKEEFLVSIWFGRDFENLQGYYMTDVIWMKTHKYSEFLKRLFAEYNENVEIEIDGCIYTEKDLPHLVKEWCTNRIIRRTIDFALKMDGVMLFGFHDTPDEFWAAMSERPFIEKLAAEKIIKYRVMREQDALRIEATNKKRHYISYIFAIIAIILLIAVVSIVSRIVFPIR